MAWVLWLMEMEQLIQLSLVLVSISREYMLEVLGLMVQEVGHLQFKEGVPAVLSAQVLFMPMEAGYTVMLMVAR